jgi:hypothetical protein
MPVVSTSEEVQELINWSWTKGVNFECILGIIALRCMAGPVFGHFGGLFIPL